MSHCQGTGTVPACASAWLGWLAHDLTGGLWLARDQGEEEARVRLQALNEYSESRTGDFKAELAAGVCFWMQ